MQKVQAAANSPADPSSQDRKVASSAAQMQANARLELAQQKVDDSKQGHEVFNKYQTKYQDSIISYLM